MKRALKYYRIIWLNHDLPAGISVFLVALPLCLGIALASNAPLYAGLISGIIGGMVVSIISGSALGVSGPAAGLTTLVAASIAASGDYRIFLCSVIIAGVLQLLLGVARLGSIAGYFPSSVIKGMLAAIGIILISKQIPVAIGYNHPDFWSSEFPSLFHPGHFENKLDALNENLTRNAIIITAVTFLLILIYKRTRLNKIKSLPLPLVIVVAGVILNIILKMISEGLKQTQLVEIPDGIFSQMTFPSFDNFSSDKVWKDGIMIGLLATLETLLCVEAIDKLDKHNRITPLNRELLAQGTGNILCGLLGAIPITAVVVRGAANIDAGGRTKLSAFTHGVLLLLAVILIPGILNSIPYASLAVILIITGYNLAKPKLFITLWRSGIRQFIPFVITIAIILFTDLLIGVCIGLLISMFFILYTNVKQNFIIDQKKDHETDVFVIRLSTHVTFLNKVAMKKALEKIPPYSVVTIDGKNNTFIDYDILEIISEYESKAHDRHIEVHLEGIKKVDIVGVH